MPGTSTPVLSRRALLAGVAASVAAARLGARPVLGQSAPELPANPFTLGVASGDPLADRVVLWTRLAPAPLEGGGMPDVDVAVDWVVAGDPSLSGVVRSGTATAPRALAHSVHVDVDGLSPDAWYWYQFRIGGWASPIGRTRTAPVAGACPSSLRFGFASCQNYPAGYYTAHAHLAEEDLDLVFFLGDYIYEGAGGGPVRRHFGGEAQTLLGYRNRYALYKSDLDLQASHQAFPWIVTWDDHEVDNNYAGAIDQDGTDPATFLVRRAAAYQAWFEHQPVRLPTPTGPDLMIYRDFRWGQLASMFVLDTRQYRSDQACNDQLGPPCAEVSDPTRTMLGATQEAWLTDGLRSSGARWNVLAQQVVFARMPFAGAINPDQWDGYPVERDRLLALLAEPAVRNPVVITGDIHASGLAELKQDWIRPRAPVVGHELVGTSISSTFPADLADVAERLILAQPYIHHANTRQRGYVTVTLDEQRMMARFRVVDTVLEPTSPVRTDFVWEVGVDEPSGCAVDEPTEPPADSTTSTTTATLDPPGGPTAPVSPTTASAPSNGGVAGVGAVPPASSASPVAAVPRVAG